jgi:hypothetical protein
MALGALSPDAAATTPVLHPLQNTWVLWFDPPDGRKEWLAGLVGVSKFTTVRQANAYVCLSLCVCVYARESVSLSLCVWVCVFVLRADTGRGVWGRRRWRPSGGACLVYTHPHAHISTHRHIHACTRPPGLGRQHRPLCQACGP